MLGAQRFLSEQECVRAWTLCGTIFRPFELWRFGLSRDEIVVILLNSPTVKFQMDIKPPKWVRASGEDQTRAG
eukprot:5531028-Amphidinium_carterae.1